MDKALAIWHWFATVGWPWFVAVAPSIIVALSKYPKAGGVVKALSTVLDFASVLTHKDSPGTAKLPFTLSAPPKPTLASVPSE